jgi:plasmid stabilization system protein ParE
VKLHVVRWSVPARADLIRLHAYLLDRATTLEELDLADQAVDAIEHTGTHGLSRTPHIYRRSAAQLRRREVIIPFGATGYVALYELLPSGDVLILAVRHQREEDYL